MTKSNILRGFRRTGIHPYNPAIFTNDDFGPSQANSTQQDVQVPESYPTVDDLVHVAAPVRKTRSSTIQYGGHHYHMLSESQILTMSLSDLQAQLCDAQKFIERSHAHNILADDRILHLQHQLSEFARKRNHKCGAVQTKARGLTSRQYLELLEQQRKDKKDAEIEDKQRKADREACQAEKRKHDTERQQRHADLQHACNHPPEYLISTNELNQATGACLKEIIGEINALAGCRVLPKTGAVNKLHQQIANYLRIEPGDASVADNPIGGNKENVGDGSGAEEPSLKRRRTLHSARARALQNAVLNASQRGWSAISCLFFGWIMVDS